MMIEYTKISWWFWLISVVLIGLGLIGNQMEAFYLLIAFSMFQIFYFVREEKSWSAFSVQVRIGFFLIVTICWWKPLNFLFWIPFVGTSALLIFGYCPLARILSLAPWNCKEPLTLPLVKRTFLSPPVRGNILQGLQK